MLLYTEPAHYLPSIFPYRESSDEENNNDDYEDNLFDNEFYNLELIESTGKKVDSNNKEDNIELQLELSIKEFDDPSSVCFHLLRLMKAGV